MSPNTTQRIPLYSAGGELQGRISLAQLERLMAQCMILRVVRHRKGHVNRAILHARLSDGAVLTGASLVGTKYSYQEHLDTGQIVWALLSWSEIRRHAGIVARQRGSEPCPPAFCSIHAPRLAASN